MRKTVSLSDILNEEKTGIEEPNKFKAVLNHNLYVPSYVHGYTLAIEYMKEWFLKELPDVNFKYIHINGKHMFDDYKRFNNQNVKREKPLLIITPTIDHEYDRDTRDVYQAPADIFLKRSNYQRSFFQDKKNNMYLGLQCQALKMRFNFRVRVSTMAQQIDIKQKMQLRFRIGATQGEYRPADFHISKDILINMAHDAGFAIKEYSKCTTGNVYNSAIKYFTIQSGNYIETKIKDKTEYLNMLAKGVYIKIEPEIVEPIAFLDYLNQHSHVPFSYKLRAITNRPEYYIRLSDIYFHIITADKLSLDEGEREGQLDNNFHIDMQAELDFPVPWFYVYYNRVPLTFNLDVTDRDAYGFYTVSQFVIPPVNYCGWDNFINTEYLAEPDEDYIDMSPIFNGTTLGKVMDATIEKFVSPDSFVDIEVFTLEAGTTIKLNTEFDYVNKIVTIPSFKQQQMLYIVVYVDQLYMNQTQLQIQKIDGKV